MPSFLPEVCVVLPQAVPPSICEEIIDIGMNHYIEYGQIGGSENGLEDHHTRKSGVAWLDREAKLQDGLTIFDHITPHIRQVNEEYFKYSSCLELAVWRGGGGSGTWCLENNSR